MSEQAPFLSLEQLFKVLSLTKTATAVHIGEDAKIQFANDAMLQIWGRDNSVIGMSLADALPELKGQPFIEMFAKVWKEGLTISGSDTAAELVINGELKTFYFDFEYRAVKDENGKVISVLHSAVDVTERFLNREELNQAKENKQLLLREQSLNEELAAANEEMLAINEELSKSREELSLLNEELEKRVEVRVKEFTESEERFRTMAEGTDVLIAVSDVEGKPFYFNKAWSKTTGRALKKLLENGWVDLLHPDDKEDYLTTHRNALLEKISYTGEFRVRDTDDNYHWLLKKGTPRFLKDGSFIGYISSCVDITERKLAERALQEIHEELATSNEELSALNEEITSSMEELELSHAELAISEERFRGLIRQAPFGICVIRAVDLMVVEVNDGYLEVVGRKREEIENLTIWEAVAEAAESYAPVLQKVIDTAIPFKAMEHEVVLVKNGIPKSVFLDFVYEPVINGLGVVTSIMVVVIDVTDKVKARRAIEDIEERIRLAVEAAEMGTYEYNYISDDLTSSDRFNQIFGFDHTVSRNQILSTYHPLDKHLSDEAHEKAKNTGKLFYETRLLFADQSLRWVRILGKVYYNEGGDRTRLLGTVLDITEYKRLQQQKDDFISIASHELKTPITSLKASLQLLERMKANPTPLLPRLIEQSTKSMGKISELVEDLLNVSRMNEGQIRLNKKPFVIAEMLDTCCTHIRQEGKYELVVQGDKTLKVIADEHRIEQVIVNFVNNAVKYAPDFKQIFISVEKFSEVARVAVTDKGPGIAPDKLPHLFDRYFRADETGAQVSGLGLGLYISSEIISRHGGEIGVESELGKGSTFWFTLPLIV
ncbi:PAS domain S-box protein [Pedobacter frigiditerrae]|uniref:PAS domain-containing sensor histidine kinase n=1 Tax=Pedobacter frigiditerrae TaxID=2530452 RepID=UPI00292E76C8|nr:PAS domain S-box protein [Pedobacter frigiditerrae]